MWSRADSDDRRDEDNGMRVVILGAESNRQLFPGKPAIGQSLSINGYPYIVIGVLASKQQNGSYGSGPDNSQLFVPYSAWSATSPRLIRAISRALSATS
jgi:putative ABC transport system permease protein